MKDVTKTNLEPVEGYVLLKTIELKKMYIELDDKSKQAYMDYQVVKGDEKLLGKCVIFDVKMLEQVTSVKDDKDEVFWLCPVKAIVCTK